MRSLRAFLQRLFGSLRRDERDAELSAEIESHLAMHVEDNLRAGMSPEEARRQALIKLGGAEQTKELCRERRSLPWLEDTLRDLRVSVRALLQVPGFTIVAVLTIALGIGANTAIFSVIDSVLLRRLPYRDSDRLVVLWEHNLKGHKPHNTVSPPDFLDWKKQNDIFTEMAAIADQRVNVTGNGDPEQVVVQAVSVNFFSLLGVEPQLGPGFLPENGQEGKDNVVILSHGYWKGRFGGDPGIIGKKIALDGRAASVVGVAPEDFDWFIQEGSLTSGRPQVWRPFVFPAMFANRGMVGRFMTVVARLKPGVTPGQAQTEMDAIAERLRQQYPGYNGKWGVTVVPLRQQLSGNLRPALLILFAAVTLVLLIACANVSSLLLSRAAAREREIAIRSALGAGTWRIARQLLTESVVLALIGGSLGAALAFCGTNALLGISPKNLLDLHAVSLDSRILAFAAAASLLSGLLFGFLPSYLSARSAIAETLKEGGRPATSSRGRRALRSGFVVAQMALALILLAGSGLLIRSFIGLSGVDPGFDINNLLTFTVALPRSKFSSDSATLVFFQRLLAKLESLPGVQAVSMDSYPPFAGLGASTAVHILSQPLLPLNDLPNAAVQTVGPGFFRTMRIPLLSGRVFRPEEFAESRHVAIVNQAFVKKYLAGGNPLGQKVAVYMRGLEEKDNPPCEIIGVVGNVHVMGLDEASEPIVYWPHPELPMTRMTILVRTSTDPLSLAGAARDQLRLLDAEQPMANIATMEQLLGDSLARSRFTMLLLGIFAGAALVLAAVGIYGVMAFNVAQRTQEIGIRSALGAQQRDVLRLILGHGARLTLLGIGLGIAGALLATRVLATLLYGVKASDPLTFFGVALILAAAALAACYLPARRATRVDPLVALRYE